MPPTIQWLSHASFKITAAETVIYIDPWKLTAPEPDADFILVSHSHFDHYSADDIRAISKPDTQLIAAADVVAEHHKGTPLAPGQTLELGSLTLTGVPAYNPDKQFHPRSNNWLGFIIEIDSKRIYYAGDTDATTEMKALTNIDLALLPVGGTYTLSAAEAAEVANTFKPRMTIPYHWGDIVGDKSDAEKFASLTQSKTIVLDPGRSTPID